MFKTLRLFQTVLFIRLSSSFVVSKVDTVYRIFSNDFSTKCSCSQVVAPHPSPIIATFWPLLTITVYSKMVKGLFKLSMFSLTVRHCGNKAKTSKAFFFFSKWNLSFFFFSEWNFSAAPLSNALGYTVQAKLPKSLEVWPVSVLHFYGFRWICVCVCVCVWNEHSQRTLWTTHCVSSWFVNENN